MQPPLRVLVAESASADADRLSRCLRLMGHASVVA